MEEESKIDFSVLTTMGELETNCEKNEHWWANNTIASVEDNLAPYHAYRNIRLILSKVGNSFQTAEERGSNPIEVENALSIMPAITSLYDFVESLKGKPVSNEMKERIYHKSRNLRNFAARYSFLPSLEEELAGINRSNLEKKISSISKEMQEEIEI